MVTQDNVREVCLALPGVVESEEKFAFSVMNKGKAKGFAWVWLERIAPKKARVPNPRFLAVRVESLEAKEIILGSNADVYFTEDHYNGFPAVLVRLDAIELGELEGLIEDAWRCMAPADLVRQYDAGEG
ncbi:MAG TPA: hypothetical protein VGK19_08495 [Capsulimonadaceae bacterium]|jgi:hypothetical protein